MIKQLIIENLSFFQDTQIEFKEGFNVITGETGAGKTLLVNTLLSLIGEKSEIFLKNEKRDGHITGIFKISDEISEELKSIDIYVEDELIIRKVIKPSNRTTIYLNDNIITQTTLKKIGNLLFDLHGQYDHQLLLKKENHIKIIDRIAQNEEILSDFLYRLKEYNAEVEKYEQLKKMLFDYSKEKDYLEFALEELEKIDIENIDETAIYEQLTEMENFENIKEVIDSSLSIIDSDDINLNLMLNNLKKNLTRLSDKSSKIGKVCQNLDLIIENLNDLYNELYTYGNELYYDAEQLEELRIKYNKLQELKKKYAMDLNMLKNFKKEIVSKLQLLNYPQDQLAESESIIMELKMQLKDIGLKLHNRRKESSKRFKESVDSTLALLNMKDTNLMINIDYNPENVNQTGYDDIEFFIINRFKEEPQPLRKVVSGGEISRIMLSIKDFLRKNDPVMTMIFDEIDIGISGDTATAVANLMKNISKYKQVITITHLPQIAAKAQNHILVKKEAKSITVKELDRDERIKEIARLLGSGESYETALKHAKALLEK